MTAKQFLERPERLNKKIKLLTEQIDMIRCSAYTKSINYDGIKISSTDKNGSIPKAIDMISEYEQKLSRALENYKKIIAETSDLIDEHVPNLKVNEALYRRYIMLQPVEGSYDENGVYTLGISDSMQKSKRQVFRLLDEGLAILENVTKCH